MKDTNATNNLLEPSGLLVGIQTEEVKIKNVYGITVVVPRERRCCSRGQEKTLLSVLSTSSHTFGLVTENLAELMVLSSAGPGVRVDEVRSLLLLGRCLWNR